MIELLKGSKHFNSIVFDGHFDVDLSVLDHIDKIHKRTGMNLIDDFAEVVYINWDFGDSNHPDGNRFTEEISPEDYNEKMKSIFNTIFFGLNVEDAYYSNWYNLKLAKNKYLKSRESDEYTRRRNEACIFTSKSKVREWVFDKYGKECLNCGSTDRIALDHVVPVSKGGENSLKNLQPLCKRCNSKKHAKIIDYRGK